MLAAILNSPAYAVADDLRNGADRPIVFKFTPPQGIDGPGSPIYCVTVPAPRPQLSHVPGGYTIHWGAKMTCTIQGTLDVLAELQQIVNGYPYTMQWADPLSKVGWDHIAANIYPCTGFDSNGWRVKFYATWNGIPGEPAWGNSAVYTLNCD
jgi:hypothetical protein